MKKIRLYIFSYNRPKYLESLLYSLDYCAWPSSMITIFDDNSDLPLAKDFLEKIKNQYQVISLTSHFKNRQKRNGGLHRMMTFALSHAKSINADYALFIQDDMRSIRAYSPHELEDITVAMESNKILMCGVQAEKLRRKEFSEKVSIQLAENILYRRRFIGKAERGFQDTGIFNVGILERIGISEFKGESEMNELLQGLNHPLMFCQRAMFAFVPFPISYSKGKVLLGDRISRLFLPKQVIKISITPSDSLPVCYDDIKVDFKRGWFLSENYRPAYSGGESRYLKRQDGILKILGKIFLELNNIERRIKYLLSVVTSQLKKF